MDLAKYTNLLGGRKSINELSRDELIQLIELIEEMEKRDEVAGLHNWLVPGTPFGIDKLHKHRAALDATGKYRETLVMGGNRCNAKGTLVATPGGPVAIEDLNADDVVYDRNGQPTRVLAVWSKGEAVVVDVVSKLTGELLLSATPDHEVEHFCTKSGQWGRRSLSECLLKSDDRTVRLRRVEIGTGVDQVVEAIADGIRTDRVYDLAVAHDDHFFLLANCISVSNCGKTRLGAMLAAVLATGLYPAWWTGARFDGPVNIWAVGKSAQTTRDTCQKELIGPVDALGTGLIPKECIGKLAKMSKPADAVESVRIKHVSGKWSTIGFKSYEQSASSFYGTAMHLIWLDEPCPELVYHEAVIRTASTGGKIFHTITPKDGLTRMLADFLAECDLLAGTESLPGLEIARALAEQNLSDDEIAERAAAKRNAPKSSRAAVAIGWDDAPWLSQETRQELLAATPPYLRDCVSRGVPSLGHSAVYPVTLDSVLCKPEEMIEIPAHWKRVYGMDVGSKTAAIFGALDPDNDILYVTGEYYGENQPKEVHAARIKHIAQDWMPGVIDPASRQRSQTDGQKLYEDYRRLGLKVQKADNSLTAGIHEVWSRLSQGRLRFWPNTPNLQREYTLYRYDDNPSNPKPVKIHDHCMDALRYMVMGLRYAKPKQISSHLNFNFPKGRRYNV
jgi:phage terminase large subunit-like protein